MRPTSSFLFQYVILPIAAAWLVFASPATQAGKQEMYDSYTRLLPRLEKNIYGVPVYIESSSEQHTMLGKVYSISHYPFSKIHRALVTPGNWCEIAPQHLNIKACTYQHMNDHCQLVFYSGRKFYEKADDVYQLPYIYRVTEPEADYFHVELTAEQGPMGTRDYHIAVEAIPLANEKTFIYFRYSYQAGFLARLGMHTYLATLGSDKDGFSITGTDEQGNPIYIQGVRGIIERNAIRYYLAIESYLQTIQQPAEQRFLARIKRWFDLTQGYPQLYEMDKKEYLEYKLKERQDQLRLQQIVNQKVRQQCDKTE